MGTCRHTALSISFFMLAAVWLGGSLVPSAQAGSRIKDIVFVEGVRSNQLLGYGIVVGLNGTGDNTGVGEFTTQSIKAVMQRFGVKTDNLSSKNVAAVMVTALLPASSLPGNTIDVTVSSLGDATSLKGGTLLLTPLMGSSGGVYAVAQGKIQIATPPGNAGLALAGNTAIETSGRIISGATVEAPSGDLVDRDPYVRLSLRTPDFTTASRIADAINVYLGQVVAQAPNPGTVVVEKSQEALKDPVGFMQKIEQLRVETDEVAKVVIDSQSGVIVMGKDVHISQVAVALDNLTIQIGLDGSGDYQTDPSKVNTDDLAYDVAGDDRAIDGDVFGGGVTRQNALPRVVQMEQGVSIQSLVRNLNALGVSTKDLIRILENIKAQGALQAEIEII